MRVYPLTHQAEIDRLTATIRGTYVPSAEEVCGGVYLAELIRLLNRAGDGAERLIEAWHDCIDASVYLAPDAVKPAPGDVKLAYEPNPSVLPHAVLLAWVPIATHFMMQDHEVPAHMYDEMLRAVWDRLTPAM